MITKDWILDSGASHYFCADLSQFLDGFVEYIKENIRIANGDTIQSEGQGKVRLVLNKQITYIDDVFPSILILNTIYASVLEVNLLSSNALGVEHGLCVNLDIPSKPSQILKGETVVGNLI